MVSSTQAAPQGGFFLSGRKAVVLSHPTESHSGYYVYGSSLLQGMREQGMDVQGHYIDNNVVSRHGSHLQTPREYADYSTEDLGFRESLEEADLIVVNLPLQVKPPRDLHEFKHKIVFVVHDVLHWCSTFGIHNRGHRCSVYRSIEGSCYDCAAYRGPFVTAVMEKVAKDWIALMSESAKVVAPSRFIKSVLSVKGCPNEVIEVVEHPVFNLNPNAKIAPASESPNFRVLVPALSYKIDLQMLFNVVTAAKETVPQMIFEVVKPNQSILNADSNVAGAVTFLGMQSNVRFVPEVPYQLSGTLFQDRDALLHLSLADESYGMIVAEALARGIPVVAYSSGALSEFSKFRGFHVVDNDVDDVITTLSLGQDLKKDDSDRANFRRQMMTIQNYVKRLARFAFGEK